MNPNTEEQQLARWLDGEMSPDERAAFEVTLAANTDLRREADALQRLRTDLQTAIPRHAEVPHADFFNSQVMRHIEGLRASERRAGTRTGLMQWFRLPWLAAAAAVCVIAMMAYNYWDANRPKTVVVYMYAPHSSVQAKTFHSKDANATVLDLDGLAAIPADRQVVGFHVGHTETDQEVAMTTLFDQQGEVLAVVGKDGRNQPMLLAH